MKKEHYNIGLRSPISKERLPCDDIEAREYPKKDRKCVDCGKLCWGNKCIKCYSNKKGTNLATLKAITKYRKRKL